MFFWLDIDLKTLIKQDLGRNGGRVAVGEEERVESGGGHTTSPARRLGLPRAEGVLVVCSSYITDVHTYL